MLAATTTFTAMFLAPSVVRPFSMSHIWLSLLIDSLTMNAFSAVVISFIIYSAHELILNITVHWLFINISSWAVYKITALIKSWRQMFSPMSSTSGDGRYSKYQLTLLIHATLSRYISSITSAIRFTKSISKWSTAPGNLMHSI